MKFGIGVVAIVLSVLPCGMWAQSSDSIGAAPPAPLLWRDGYINWRGKLVKPNWRVMSAGDGTQFAINLGPKAAHFATAYIIDGDAFNRNNLFEFHFDCVGKVSEVVSNMDLKRAQIVEARVRQLVCDDAPEIP
jgi:hypothetical protein